MQLRSIDIQKNKKTSNILQSRRSIAGNVSVLYSRGMVSQAFYTEDSKKYITPKEFERMCKGEKLDRRIHKWDALSSRVLKQYTTYIPQQESKLVEILQGKLDMLAESASNAQQSLFGYFSVVKLWNLSIVGAILFGMVTMTMIYRYLGQGASAGNVAVTNPSVQTSQVLNSNGMQNILDAQKQRGELEELTAQAMSELAENQKQEDFEMQVKKMVKGYPIEEMLPYILEKDRIVASFLIAIGKKESAWGKRVPVLDGQDCYNYWGYRGKRKLMGSGGHTCFNSRKDAVDTVAKRIETLVEKEKLNTAEKMVVWKCGNSCAGHGKYDVQKWISDVDMYYKKLNEDQ